jgi:hypothetical protein
MFGRRLLTCAGVLLGHALVVGAFFLLTVMVTVQQPSAITVRLIAEERKAVVNPEFPAKPAETRLGFAAWPLVTAYLSRVSGQ